MFRKTILTAGLTMMVWTFQAQILRAQVFHPNLGVLVQNALAKLPPARAVAARAELQSTPPAVLQAYAQVVVGILQRLPSNVHQTFVNGLFETSPQEARFANEIINQALAGLNQQGMGGPTNSDFLSAQRMNRWLTWCSTVRSCWR